MCCDVLQYIAVSELIAVIFRTAPCNLTRARRQQHVVATKHCNTLQQTTSHCSTMQHNAAHHNTLQHTGIHLEFDDGAPGLWMWHIFGSSNTLHHAATHCHTLQHTWNFTNARLDSNLPFAHACSLSSFFSWIYRERERQRERETERESERERKRESEREEREKVCVCVRVFINRTWLIYPSLQWLCFNRVAVCCSVLQYVAVCCSV